MKKNTIEVRVLAGRLALENARKNAQIKAALAQFGYNDARILEGEDKLNAAEEWQQTQKDLYTDKSELSRQLAEDEQELLAIYTNHLTIARFAFRNDEVWQKTLELNGPRATVRAGKLDQIRTFYRRLTTPAINTLKKFGVVTEEITQAQAMADTLVDVLGNRQNKQAEAQQATQYRNQALEAWETWFDRFSRVAEVALMDQPQLLEALGIEVRS
ncbi:MAG: hypothetical protein ACFB15_06685 [Cyclobacteriaceae bacterium]